MQPRAVCRHRCLKCPGWRRRLLPDRFPAQLCGPGTSLSCFTRSLPPRPSSRPRLLGSGLGRFRCCRRRRCCEHIPPRGLNAGAGVGRESGSPNFPLHRSLLGSRGPARRLPRKARRELGAGDGELGAAGTQGRGPRAPRSPAPAEEVARALGRARRSPSWARPRARWPAPLQPVSGERRG